MNKFKTKIVVVDYMVGYRRTEIQRYELDELLNDGWSVQHTVVINCSSGATLRVEYIITKEV